MLSWLLIIFVISLSVTLGVFASRFLKCSFHFCIHSSWLTTFSFTLKVLLVNYLWLPWNSIHSSWFGWYTLCCCCFHVGSDKVFIFIIWSMFFRYLLKSIELVSYSYHIFIANISIGKWGQVVMCSFDCLFLTSVYTRAYLCCANSVIGKYSFKRGVCIPVQSAIYPLLFYEYII